MTRSLPRAALALACVAPLLGGCNLTASQQTAVSDLAGTLTAGTITLAQLTPAFLNASGVDAETQAKAKSVLAQIIATAQVTCGFAPTASSILNIATALNPGSAVVPIPVNVIVDTACRALTAPTAKSVQPLTASRLRSVAPRSQTVQGEITVNGTPLTITGFRDPSLAVTR